MCNIYLMVPGNAIILIHNVIFYHNSQIRSDKILGFCHLNGNI